MISDCFKLIVYFASKSIPQFVSPGCFCLILFVFYLICFRMNKQNAPSILLSRTLLDWECSRRRSKQSLLSCSGLSACLTILRGVLGPHEPVPQRNQRRVSGHSLSFWVERAFTQKTLRIGWRVSNLESESKSEFDLALDEWQPFERPQSCECPPWKTMLDTSGSAFFKL